MSSLPEGLFFDLVSTEEVEAVHQLEIQGKPSLILFNALLCNRAFFRFLARRGCYHREAAVCL